MNLVQSVNVSKVMVRMMVMGHVPIARLNFSLNLGELRRRQCLARAAFSLNFAVGMQLQKSAECG